ncbi:NAD(P)-dependent alcohol dehydrogenase [Streptomyces durmitorensis]|uniref:NAD(P)-dependent alcohol dehydrogenase n=1 Tax=Streptomyces durmitorensis TaxID=319947 RepID=A0ABY4PJE4_9ACTN|nr:NAD(P)-dependent alcohol dehydrogenase [Streptomyces durmitorensis]UQT53732.1 NAD(P)-dependent alcohol dehydrogenase [Streptomyces durmitorensis]
MKAIAQGPYGTADVLELRDIDRPVPHDNEVLVQVRAAGVDPSVLHLMTGKPYIARLAWGLRKPKNPVRGWDVAGVVETVGAKVARFKPGDEVFGSGDGSLAEYTCARADKLAPRPGNLTFEQAAALPVSGVTACQALSGKARPTPEQKVLVIGASGGIGTYAVQLAVSYGAEVTAVCGPGRADFVRALGATDVIDYTRQEITDGKHLFDIILDAAGNRPLSLLRRALAPKGVLVMAGGEGGGDWVGGLGRQLRGYALSPFLGQTLSSLIATVRHKDLLTLKRLAEAGTITPAIDRTYPLSEAVAAIKHLETGHPRGKIVVTP